jgi:hypothetical protein
VTILRWLPVSALTALVLAAVAFCAFGAPGLQWRATSRIG